MEKIDIDIDIEKLDSTLKKLWNKEITKWEARKQLFGKDLQDVLYICPESSKFKHTLLVLRSRRCLDVHWCLGKLKYVKVCPHCKREFETTEVPSGIFCCYACEHGY